MMETTLKSEIFSVTKHAPDIVEFGIGLQKYISINNQKININIKDSSDFKKIIDELAESKISEWEKYFPGIKKNSDGSTVYMCVRAIFLVVSKYLHTKYDSNRFVEEYLEDYMFDDGDGNRYYFVSKYFQAKYSERMDHLFKSGKIGKFFIKFGEGGLEYSSVFVPPNRPIIRISNNDDTKVWNAILKMME